MSVIAESDVPVGARVVDLQELDGTFRSDHVIEEVPVALVYNGISHAVMMATPLHLEDFALGFSLSEGIIDTPSEIYDIEVRSACGCGLEVSLTISSESFWKLKEHRRTLAGRTGCGICGTESLDGVARSIQPLAFSQKFDMKHYGKGLKGIAETEQLRNLTGGTHAAVWLRHDGTVAFGREDVGRHVALDKLLGCRARTNETDGALFISSRASFEMVQKAAACGVEILFAVSAPTALAIDVARRSNLTLAAFCRNGRGNIYTHPQRLIGL